MTDKQAGEIIRGIIHRYIGPDHRVMDMPSLYRVLVQALQAAHQQACRTEAKPRG